MGINYYFNFSKCKCCGRSEQFHIGKLSEGWSFSFQAHEERDLDSWEKYQIYFKNMPGNIVDEYVVEYSLDEFKQIVEKAQKLGNKRYADLFKEDSFLDSEGYSFSKYEFR